VSNATGSPRDAASVLLDLPGYRVIDAVDRPGGGREVTAAGLETEAACPTCGVLSARVHQRTRQRVRDVPVAGRIDLVVAKRRFACTQSACPRRTFTEVSDQLPARARVTTRLRVAVVDAVAGARRAICEVAGAHGLDWRTVQRVVTAAADTLADPDTVAVRRLGVDEHRYRSVRFFRDEAGGWRRYEPWMTTFVDAESGQVLGVVDGRDSAAVASWLQARSPAWREAVEVVAIDPSAAFRRALREQLPRAAVSVDAFHLVQLGNDMVTKVRQRVSQDLKARRGRLLDPAWANRRLLLRAGDRLSPRALARLEATLAADDPTNEIGAAWGVKELLRQLLQAPDLAAAAERRAALEQAVTAAAMPETTRLLRTVTAWWPAIEVLLVTGVTNARTEAANTTIKLIKRTGRGYRNPANYRARILLASAARTAA
jgi:transposase